MKIFNNQHIQHKFEFILYKERRGDHYIENREITHEPEIMHTFVLKFTLDGDYLEELKQKAGY